MATAGAFAVLLVALAVALRRGRAFLAATAGPYSLAVFRIAVFAVVLRMVRYTWPAAVSYAGLPRSAVVPPWGLRRVLAVTPLSPGLARAAGLVVLGAALCGLVGAFARSAAATAAVAGVYFFGIPGFYGKVDHGSHVLWCLALLAVSPCADVLSVDGVRLAWRRADAGDVAPPGASRAYGLPIRLAWLLVALLYLFPGFWKLRSAGLAWAVSDNLRNIMFGKWAELGVTPSFASFVEHNVRLTQLAALGAMTFELGFLVALFFRRARAVAVVAGFAFHLANRYVLYIDFWPLYWLYVVFVPWETVLAAVGRRLFPRPLVAAYDGGCGICRRTVATANVVDPLGRVTWVPAAEADVGVPRDALLADLHAVEDGRTYVGYAAYRRITRRLPLLWPVLPLLYLPPVAALGRRAYRWVADSRACAVAPLPAPAGAPSTPVRPRALLLVWLAVAVPAVAFGVAGIEQAWPVSAYPAFRGIRAATEVRLDATYRDAGGERPLDLRGRLGYSPQAWTAVSRRVAALGPSGRAAEARTLRAALVARSPDLARYPVTVVLTTFSTLPSRRGAAPLRSDVLLTVGPG